MEFEQENLPVEPQQQDYDIEIYSRSAIWGFSIFFYTIFGGVLLMLNLRSAGYKKEGTQVLLFSIGYLLLTTIIANYTGAAGSAALLFNVIGAAILTQVFYNRYFPETDYHPKSIVRPLVISLLIYIPIVIFVLYYGPKPGIK